MAVALEGFSIRGYVGKMRTVDFRKCWPFDGDGLDQSKGGELTPSLPPISIRNYRWWSDELEPAQSGKEEYSNKAGTSEQLMPDLKADRCPAARNPYKGKQRAPKKRSIVEIFAVAPQVEAIDDDQDEDDETGTDDSDEREQRGDVDEDGVQDQEHEEQTKENGSGDGDHEGVGSDGAAPGATTRKTRERAAKGDKKKEIVRRKIWMKYKKSNNNRKRGRPKMEMLLAAKKEKIRKSQMTCAADVSHLLQGSVFSEMVTDPVDAQKKKPPRVKSLSKRHSVKFIQSSKLLAKNQESVKVSPVHSILKNQLKANSSKKTSFKGDSRGGNLIKGRCESEKHVTFSGKDDILGHNKCSPIELPQFQSLCKILSNVLAVSSAMKDANNGDKIPVSNERAQVMKASANDTTATVIDSTIRSSSEKKHSTDADRHANFPINLSNRNNLDPEKASLGVTIDLNYAMESSCDLNCLNTDGSALSPRDSYCGSSQILNSTYKEVLSSDSGYQAEESCTRMSNSKGLPVPMGICVSRSHSTSPLPQPMVSCSITSMQANESQQHRSIEPKIDSFMHTQEYQPVCNISPRDLMSGICSLVGTKKHAELRPVPDQLSICGDKHNAENFIGLPLNSQGELINSQSTGNFDFSDLFRKQNTLLGSDCGSPVPTLADPKNRLDQTKMKEQLPGTLNDRLNWFPEPANKCIASCFDINELQDSEEIEVQDHESVRDTDASFQQDPNLMRASCYGCKVDNQTHNWIDSGKFQADRNLDHRTRPATQRTIHLMGKYVTVGRNSNDCHGFDDGKIWTDKEIITEQCPEPLSMQWPQQVEVAHPASGTSMKNHLQSLEAPTSSCHLPAVEQHFDRMRFDGQRQWRSGNNLYSTYGSHGFKVHRSNHPPPLKVLLSKISKSVANSNSLSEYLEMGNQIPLVGSRPQNVSQQMLLGSTHSKCNQSLSCSTSSSSSSQFPDSHNGNFVEPPSAHPSSYLPKWLLNPKQQKKNQNISFPSNTIPMSMHHRCTKAGGNLLPLPSPYTSSIVSHLNDDNATSRRSPSTPSSLVLPSFIPSHPASEFAPAVYPTNGKKVNIGDGKQSNFKYFKLLDRANITRKRHADRGIDFMRQVKKPSLTGHGLSNVPSGPNRREQLLGCIPYSTVYPETPVYWNKAMDVDLMITNNEKNGFRTASGSSSLPPDGGSISGPLKLSAGAKHILKPSQNMDQDNSIPIHSTIPFALGTSSGKIPVSQMKASHIYRF